MMQQPKCTIALSSMTYAMKASEILQKSRIRIKIVKLRSGDTPMGCSYGIELSCNDINRAVSILKNERIYFSDIIRKI